MNLKTARGLTGAYLMLATIFVTWPGVVPFARIEPLALGLPFSMAWIASWIAGLLPVLFLLDRVERRYRLERQDQEDSTPGTDR
jgi:hypothetical protein